MKFSENWLRSYVNPRCSSHELAHTLTMAGVEVENIEPVAATIEKVVVAEVVEVSEHPNADRLKVCQVNVGDHADKVLQIVCGAPNVETGIKVPCALVGAQLPNFVVKNAKLRGVESSGMLCSARELGINEAAVDGLLLLPRSAQVGQDFRDYYTLDDNIITLSLTPNRADCLSVYGLAREVSAVTNVEIASLEIEPVAIEIADQLEIQIIAPEACPLYSGRIIRGINAGVETPLWMKQRLERSGLRSINAVVDITNYVLLETGQPMHAFDLAKLEDAIQVRYAKTDETIKLLNENNIDLTSDLLLISDNRGPLALAGIMGGLESSVVDDTTDIFLECAFFSPDVISGKSFQLGFSSESAHRFERGVDFAATRSVLERASCLIKSICGGKAGPITEISYQLPKRPSVNVRTDRVQRILGITLSDHQIREYLSRQHFDFYEKKGIFTVTPPSYRFDLTIEEDFIEELARIHGYDEIPIQLPKTRLAMLAVPESRRTPTEIKQVLVLRDYQEVVNYAFVDKTWETDLLKNKIPIELKNPIASHLSVMRSSLMGGLLSNLQFNLNRKQDRVRIFEMGCCFERGLTDQVVQIEKIAGLAYGSMHEEQWGLPSSEIDFYDVKADVEILYDSEEVAFQAITHPVFHPGKSAQIMLGAKPVGWLGELHPYWQKTYELPRPVILFELLFESLQFKPLAQMNELSKYPPVRRDIAVIVDNQVNVQSILTCLLEKKSSIVIEIALFDIYRGDSIGENRKSLAFKIMLQDSEKTLTDQDADAAISELLQVLEAKFGATLRT